MRYRVDTRWGYASFGEDDEQKAREMYEDSGVRLVRCKDLNDEGEVIEGLPLGVESKSSGEVN